MALSIYTLYPYPETCWPQAVWPCQCTRSTLSLRLAGPRQYGLVNIHSLPLPRDLLARGSMALSLYTLYPFPETCWPKAVWPCQYTLSTLTPRLAGLRQYGLVIIHSLPLPLDLLTRGSTTLSIYTLYPYPETCWPKQYGLVNIHSLPLP